MEMYIYILVVRLYITCVRKIHIHIYNKIFNPLVLLVGVGDCKVSLKVKERKLGSFV